MYDVLLWGTGQYYSLYFDRIRQQVANDQINVVGVVSNETQMAFIDGYRFVPKSEVINETYDYVIAMMVQVDFALAEELFAVEKIIPVRVFSLPYFDFEKYIKIKNSKITIISQMCFGGLCYHKLGLPFYSPTINMAFAEEDFIRMLSDLKSYMNLPLEYVSERYESNQKRMAPVGRIGDVEIFFNHYKTFEEAVAKWEERKKKINWNHLFVIAYTDNPLTEKAFQELPLENKKIFVPYLTDCKDSVRLLYDENKYDGNIGMQVNDIATGKNNQLDLLKLLNGEEDFERVTFKMN